MLEDSEKKIPIPMLYKIFKPIRKILCTFFFFHQTYKNYIKIHVTKSYDSLFFHNDQGSPAVRVAGQRSRASSTTSQGKISNNCFKKKSFRLSKIEVLHEKLKTISRMVILKFIISIPKTYKFINPNENLYVLLYP